ncbi:putative 1-aminocyclopropane-1-carboxylate synthase protein [Botrytis fragariae]|uniref:Putative 1-aminocyclopropane-1-carboxylate synthase protein n=1 Tax=Botrytis fragariae TaxID=1964551 RepID=A0A8H6AQB7_9HELO|nr:putative 1-aminocyclopropane-1-carboxylate synthase protein [Botrytis fragariae]KAF5871647.1 putative 1-aminocyclopropane-1-carboxylate synthase protein [Botrytis fragariae]
MSNFLNQYFDPDVAVLPKDLVIAPGAAACLDALLYNICDTTEGVLIPDPYWNGNDIFLRIRSQATLIPVTVSTFSDSFTTALLDALDTAYSTSSVPVKALLIANPHNPLGRCYTPSLLVSLQFCEKHDIHFISDEGVTITQHNSSLRDALALASHMNLSTMSTVYATSLLRSARLPGLLSPKSQRLSNSYTQMIALFKKYDIKYFPCNAGLFILARIVPEGTWEKELGMVDSFKRNGVLIGPGKRYHVLEPAWTRISFAMEPEVLNLAIERMDKVFKLTSEQEECRNRN